MTKTFLASLLLSLASAGAANASLIATVSPTGALPGQIYVSLNSLPLGNMGGMTNTNITVAFTGPNAAIVSGSVVNGYSAPVFSNGNGAAFGDGNGVDTTKYIAVGVGSTATLSIPTALQSLGLLWGSVDSYNTLTFFSGVNGTGTNVGSLTGADLPSTGSNGNQTAVGTAYVNISSTQSFQSIVLTSTVNAFELDNLAFGTRQSVPEPVSMALLGSGLVGIAAFRRRRAK